MKINTLAVDLIFFQHTQFDNVMLTLTMEWAAILANVLYISNFTVN